MMAPYEQLDRRFAELQPLAAKAVRPQRGWVRAIREALGMTTAQLAKRIGVTQPRVMEIEKAEVSGAITLASLERAAEALECRVVYLLVPTRPLTEVVHARAREIAGQQVSAVEQTMQLEQQSVSNDDSHRSALAFIMEKLLRRPARLWDAP